MSVDRIQYFEYAAFSTEPRITFPIQYPTIAIGIFEAGFGPSRNTSAALKAARTRSIATTDPFAGNLAGPARTVRVLITTTSM